MHLKINHPINNYLLDWLEAFQPLIEKNYLVYEQIDNNNLWKSFQSTYKVKSIKWCVRDYSMKNKRFIIPSDYIEKAKGNYLDSIPIWGQPDCFSLPELAEIIIHNTNGPCLFVLEIEYYQDSNDKIVKKLQNIMRIFKNQYGDFLIFSANKSFRSFLLTDENLSLSHISRQTKLKEDTTIAPVSFLDLLGQTIELRDRVAFQAFGNKLSIGQVVSFKNNVVLVSYIDNKITKTAKIKSTNLLVLNSHTENCLLEYILSSSGE